MTVKHSNGDDDRGVGTTTAQLQRLRDGDVFIVSNGPMISYCMQLMSKHGIRTRVQFTTPEEARRRMTGRSGMVHVDHACRLPENLREHVLNHNRVHGSRKN